MYTTPRHTCSYGLITPPASGTPSTFMKRSAGTCGGAPQSSGASENEAPPSGARASSGLRDSSQDAPSAAATRSARVAP